VLFPRDGNVVKPDGGADLICLFHLDKQLKNYVLSALSDNHQISSHK